MKVIAVANQKGGVGKTTTAVNASACLAEKGKRVLIIDIDPQGNTTSGLGIDRKTVGFTVYDVLINGTDIKKAVVHTAWDNLDICSSSIHLAGAEIELVSVQGREFRLKNALKAVRDDYDFVIIDCPPSLGFLTLNALAAANTVLIPIQCEYYALEGLSQLTATIRSVRKSINPDLDIEGALLTMFDARTNLSIEVVEEVKRALPHKVCSTIIPRNVRLSEAPSFGEPIIAYDTNSRGAMCYRALAEELIERIGGVCNGVG
ncbi:MAG: Sporulation initiation inhibitor protein Soj [Firmicutes bacterium ADurb.Bin193]|nr:MAG: Sporulation initiation inhibitor protein Soj [Firmicutes bacterium ADurb.Bin193]